MYNGFLFDEKGVFYILTVFSSFMENVLTTKIFNYALINTQTKYAPICLQIKDSVVTDS